jgi:hypothetical protein
MERRTYLRSVAAVCIGALAGCPSGGGADGRSSPTGHIPSPEPGATASRRRAGSAASRTVDLVAEGADPTGDEPIDEVLADAAGADTRVVLPPGRYRLGRHELTDVDGFELVGRNATIVPDGPGARPLFVYYRVSNLLVAGLTIDQSEPSTAGSMDLRPTGGVNVVRDVRLSGRRNLEVGTFGLLVLVEGADTTLRFERVDMRDGARNGAAVYAFSPRHFFDSRRDPGSLAFRNCWMENWQREGLYASSHAGPISVVGGRYANNGIDQLRLGGGIDHDVTISGVSVLVDDPPADIARSRYGNFRGIWLEEGDGCTIENCDVAIRDVGAGGSDGAVVVSDQFGRATITGSTIRTDERVPALNVDGPAAAYDPESMIGIDRLPSEWGVTCSDLHLTGASDGAAAVLLGDRDDCVFRNVRLDQSAGTRHGLVSVDAAGTRLEGGRWESGGYPAMIGQTVTAAADTPLLCVDALATLRSRTYGGSPLEATVIGGGSASLCVPASYLRGHIDGTHIPYLGVSARTSEGLRGQRVRARWDGTGVVRMQ